MADKMDGNKAGKYDLVHNEAGMAASGGRLYYQTYIPADLGQAGIDQLFIDEWQDGIKRIYGEIGRQQGFCFFEREFRQKEFGKRNDMLYRQEMAALLGLKDKQVELTDIFSDQPVSEIKKRLPLYEHMEKNDGPRVQEILLGRYKSGRSGIPIEVTKFGKRRRLRGSA